MTQKNGSKFCCESFENNFQTTMDWRYDDKNFPDILEYGLSINDSAKYIKIRYCPWCATEINLGL